MERVWVHNRRYSADLITRHPLKVWVTGTKLVLSKLCGLEVRKWDEMKYGLSW